MGVQYVLLEDREETLTEALVCRKLLHLIQGTERTLETTIISKTVIKPLAPVEKPHEHVMVLDNTAEGRAHFCSCLDSN